MSAVRCRFGIYTFDPALLELRRHGVPVRLQDKPALVLAKLLEQPGALVTREDLCRHLWPDGTYVEFDAGLNSAVRRLREALDDSAETPRYIETMARRGYRFIAPAEWLAPADPPAPAPSSPPPPKAVRWEAPFVVLLVLVLVVALMSWRTPLPASDSPRVLVAVLPFTELSGDPEQQYFADGLTEDVIAQLGRVEPVRLGVIALGSVMRYKGVRRNLREVGRDLGVAHLIEGGVQRAGSRVRVTARLIDAESERQRWSATYERGIEDVLGLQADLARAIAQEIRVPVPADGGTRRSPAPPLDPLAYDEYLKGRHFWSRRTPQDLQRALTFFRMALARDPGYASAQAGMAEAFVYLGWYGFEAPHAAFPRAREAAEAALASDPAQAGARAALGATRMLYDWDLAAGQRDFRQAIELNPSYATVHHWYGFSLAAEGRHDDAIAEIRQGQTLDPLSPGVRAGLAYALLCARRYAEAVEECRDALLLDPGYLAVYKILGWTYEEQGQYDEALRIYDEGESATGVGLDADRARTLALAGRTQEARQALARVEAMARERYVPASYLARVRVALGENEAALALLEKALADRAPELVHPRFATEFAPLAGEPRFQALRRRLGRE